MSKKSIASPKGKQVDELYEDMEVVGPGQMLSEARKKLSLSAENVAEKLKFKKNLIQNIEQDLFDPKLPATFNRGYLRNYAKLVNIDVDEVLSAYDMLGIAEAQRSEMQSFSNLTEKQAEHSRLMWLSYFIAAILCGLVVLWWLQEPKQTADEGVSETQPVPTLQSPSLAVKNNTELATLDSKPESIELTSDKSVLETAKPLPIEESTKQEVISEVVVEPKVASLEEVTPDIAAKESDKLVTELSTAEFSAVELSTAVFTFSGDCWVNIFDATGERIAWGVKKLGYEMTITGQAPLTVTLGKPELAAIVFNGQLIDMSEFNKGNIAKFTLPLNL